MYASDCEASERIVARNKIGQGANKIMEKATFIADACILLASRRDPEAKAILRTNYPFESLSNKRGTPGRARSVQIFRRDSFLDRYSGQRLVFPGTLLVMAKLMPEDFPAHPNWKTEGTHFAFYELWPVIDHVRPITRGGTNDDDNFVTTSAVRNSAKAHFTLDELGWMLLPASTDREWDGLTAWFVDITSQRPELLTDAAIAKWRDALKVVA